MDEVRMNKASQDEAMEAAIAEALAAVDSVVPEPEAQVAVVAEEQIAEQTDKTSAAASRESVENVVADAVEVVAPTADVAREEAVGAEDAAANAAAADEEGADARAGEADPDPQEQGAVSELGQEDIKEPQELLKASVRSIDDVIAAVSL